MCVLLLFFFIGGGVLAAPQGYSYQVVPAGSNEYPLEQYQLLQQQIEQHQRQLADLVGQQQQQQPSTSDIKAAKIIAPDLSNFVEQQQPQELAQPQQQNTNLKTFILEVQPEQAQPPEQQQLLSQQQQSHEQHEQQQEEQDKQALQQKQYQQPPQAQQQLSIVELEEQYRPTRPPQQVARSQPETQPPFQLPRIQVPATYQPQPQRASVQYNKQFFYLSAPQEDFEEPRNVQDQFDQIRRNVRVVFIKAPENNGIANAALHLAKQSADEQTAIYVLSKQHDASDLASKLQQVRAGAHNKPEVVFIKYKTPEEAAHAQRTIQAQYETLDGPNHFNHDGVAPTHNFVGSVGAAGGLRAVGGIGEVSSKYLPAVQH